ncbi:MAG: hypothetical protein IT288_09505 [Bdellovibrionales bacterium]|nr:hypothetical protein [Bdellovibrionales bacterium]
MSKLLVTAWMGFFAFVIGAQARTAVPVAEVIRQMAAQSLPRQDQALVFGYDSLQSCLYSNDHLSVFRHYCYPVGSYPARAYTVISPELGAIYFYEEDLGDTVLREIAIEIFPDDLPLYGEESFAGWKIKDWNGLFSFFYDAQNAACWATNYSRYTKQPEARCYQDDISNYPAWSQEAMAIVSDVNAWNQILETLLQQTP